MRLSQPSRSKPAERPFRTTGLSLNNEKTAAAGKTFRRYKSSSAQKRFIGQKLFGGTVAALCIETGTLIVANGTQRSDGPLVTAMLVPEIALFRVGHFSQVFIPYEPKDHSAGEWKWASPVALDSTSSTIFIDQSIGLQSLLPTRAPASSTPPLIESQWGNAAARWETGAAVSNLPPHDMKENVERDAHEVCHDAYEVRLSQAQVSLSVAVAGLAAAFASEDKGAIAAADQAVANSKHVLDGVEAESAGAGHQQAIIPREPLAHSALQPSVPPARVHKSSSLAPTAAGDAADGSSATWFRRQPSRSANDAEIAEWFRGQPTAADVAADGLSGWFGGQSSRASAANPNGQPSRQQKRDRDLEDRLHNVEEQLAVQTKLAAALQVDHDTQTVKAKQATEECEALRSATKDKVDKYKARVADLEREISTQREAANNKLRVLEVQLWRCKEAAAEASQEGSVVSAETLAMKIEEWTLKETKMSAQLAMLEERAANQAALEEQESGHSDELQRAMEKQRKQAVSLHWKSAALGSTADELKGQLIRLQDAVEVELTTSKKMVHSGLWKDPIQDETLKNLMVAQKIDGQTVFDVYDPNLEAHNNEHAITQGDSWFKAGGCFNHVNDHAASGITAQSDEQKFQMEVEDAETPTAIVGLLITQHRKVKLQISTAFMQRLSKVQDELSAAKVERQEADDQVDEMHRVLGPATIRAHAFMRRRLSRWRLKRGLRALLEHGPAWMQKRIENAVTADHVLVEMITVSEKFTADLHTLNTTILQPIQDQFLTQEIGTTADPNGWVLNEFEVFLRAVQSLHAIHAEALPDLMEGTPCRRKLGEFYIELAEKAREPLVSYMNRLSFIMALIKDKARLKDLEDGIQLKDFLWTAERQSETKRPVNFFLFGVLQAATNWHGMLTRLKKLTLKTHIAYGKLQEAENAISEMTAYTDRACREYAELKDVQKSLHQSPVYVVREKRKVWHQGGTFTLGRVDSAADLHVDLAGLHVDVTAISNANSNGRNRGGCCGWIGDRLITDPCHLILLSTMLLMCEPICAKIPNPRYRTNSKRHPKDIDTIKYVVRHIVHRPETAEECKIKSYEAGHVFSIQCQGLILFKCASEANKEQWIVKFIEAWQTPIECCAHRSAAGYTNR